MIRIYAETREEFEIMERRMESIRKDHGIVYSLMKSGAVYEDTVNKDKQPLTEEEVIAYMRAKGTGINMDGTVNKDVLDWWLTNPKRRQQVTECVRNNYDLIDFDEWQLLQDILFKDQPTTISAKTACIISNALWEEDIEVLELSTEPLSL